MAFKDTADKDKLRQRIWEVLSSLYMKLAPACYKNKQMQRVNALQKVDFEGHLLFRLFYFYS